MDIFKINGSLIQELRDEMGWTREDLCEKSGVPIGTIQDIELEKSKNPSFGNIKKLLRALPNFTQHQKKTELLGEIILALSALDYDQLRSVLKSIELLPSAAASKSKTTGAD